MNACTVMKLRGNYARMFNEVYFFWSFFKNLKIGFLANFCEGFEEILHYGTMRCRLSVGVCSLGIYFWEHLELRNLANVSLGT